MALKLNPQVAAKVAHAAGETGTAAMATMDQGTDSTELTVASTGTVSLRDAPGVSSDPTLSWPRLALAHGVGDLANAGFPNGAFVYDKEHVIAAFGQELTFLFASEPKLYWKENLPGPYNPNAAMPRIFVTEEQFKAEGLTDEWDEHTPPTVDRAMRMILLVKKPEGMPITTAEMDLGAEGIWLPCVYDVDKSAYREVARLVSQAFLGKCKGNPRALTFGLRCVKKTFKNSGQTANIPTMRVVAMTSPSLLEALEFNFAVEA